MKGLAAFVVKYSFCLLFILGLLAACQPKPLDIDIQPAPPKLVISSQVVPNEEMVVLVTRSFSALEDKSNGDSVPVDFLARILVRNALVVVSYLGQIDTLTMKAPGVYSSESTLLYNYGTYTLQVIDYEGGLEVSANTTMLPPVLFDSVRPLVIKNPGDTVVNVFFRLRDKVAEENFYLVNYVRKLNESNSNTVDLSQLITNGNPLLATYFDVLEDKDFKNGVYEVERKLEGFTARDSIAITVSNISRDYFLFLETYKRAGSFINLITGEPINYPTNVQGGYGYFNAHYPDVRVFDLNEY